MWGGAKQGSIYVFLRHHTGSLQVAWQSLPFPDFLHLGSEGKGGANLGPLGKVYLHQCCLLLFVHHLLAIIHSCKFSLQNIS